MKLKLLKGLALALALTLMGTAAVPVNAANTNGNVMDKEMLDGEMDMDEEMLDGEMDMDEDCGSLELDADLADIDNEFEGLEGALEGFNVEGFTELFSEALTSESDLVNTVYGDYSLQTGSDNDGAITEVNTEEISKSIRNGRDAEKYGRSGIIFRRFGKRLGYGSY